MMFVYSLVYTYTLMWVRTLRVRGAEVDTESLLDESTQRASNTYVVCAER
jgi:hypothetical protein